MKAGLKEPKGKDVGLKTVSAALVFVSLTASAYYLVAGLTKPESMAVYSRANIPVWGIRTWAVLLGAAGLLLVFPLTFRLATILMVMNSLFTIACFVLAKDWRGGVIEALLLQVPVFLFSVGHPTSARRGCSRK